MPFICENLQTIQYKPGFYLGLGKNGEKISQKCKIRIQLGLDFVDKGVKTLVAHLSYIRIKFANMKRSLKGNN